MIFEIETRDTVAGIDILNALTAAGIDHVILSKRRSKDHQYRDGEPCSHPGCLNHVTHPCEGCGRVGGRSIRTENNIGKY